MGSTSSSNRSRGDLTLTKSSLAKWHQRLQARLPPVVALSNREYVALSALPLFAPKLMLTSDVTAFFHGRILAHQWLGALHEINQAALSALFGGPSTWLHQDLDEHDGGAVQVAARNEKMFVAAVQACGRVTSILREDAVQVTFDVLPVVAHHNVAPSLVTRALATLTENQVVHQTQSLSSTHANSLRYGLCLVFD